MSVPLGTGRLVEVGRALAAEPTVMLLDEPSSGLDVHETEQLGEALRRVRADRGTAFVLVEHNVEFVLELSDRVTVLDFGKVLTEGTPDEIRNSAEVQAAYFGAPVEDVDDRASATKRRAPETTRDRDRSDRGASSRPLLRVTDLEVAYGEARALFGVSFDVRAGSVTTVLGANGAGQVVARSSDRWRGQAVRRAHRVRRRRHHRPGRAQGVQARASRSCPSLATSSRTSRCATTCGRRSGSRCRARIARAALERALELFPVLAERRRQAAGTLSGGEQQMLSLARVLAAPPKLLIADEMSLGLAPQDGRPRVRVARRRHATKASPCCSSSSSWSGRSASPTTR